MTAVLRAWAGAALLAGCAAEAPPEADAQAILAAVEHAELQLEGTRNGAAPRAAEAGAP